LPTVIALARSRRSLRKEDFVPAPPTAFHRVDGDLLRPRFAAAVGHLRDELARGDQSLHDSITVPWAEFARAELFVDTDLVLTWADASGQAVRVPAGAFPKARTFTDHCEI
jgi:hypothetical protein